MAVNEEEIFYNSERNGSCSKKVFLSACSVTLLQSALLLCIPLLYQKLIDNVLPQKDVKIFLKIIFLVLLMYTINSCLNILKDYLLAKFAENIARDLRQKLNDRICDYL